MKRLEHNDHDDENLKPTKRTKKFLAKDAMLNYPSGVFVTPNDEVFIADYWNNRVRKILCDGTIVTIAGNGKEGFSGDGGPATDAELNNPLSVFVSSQNEVYIVDHNNFRIRKIKTDGTIITIAGNGRRGFSGDGGLAINAQISNVYGIYVSENDEVYLADDSNNRIRKVLKNGNIITIAGNGKQKYVGDGVLATETGLNSPQGVFVSQNDEIYISDKENNCIRTILNNGTIVTIAGTGEKGFNGDGRPSITSKLYYPRSLFVSSQNEIYFVDRENFRIRKILKNGNIETVVGNGEYGFSGDNGLAINAKISYVYSLSISENDELYFADSVNNRIRKVLRNGTIITIAGNGEKGYSGDSPFDFSLNPHIGYRANYRISNNRKLKKHSRDEIFGLELIGFIPLIEKLSPQFCKIILKNENILKSMNSQQLQIIQKLIDSLIYESSLMIYGYYDSLDVLFILGMFKNCEFINLKRKLTSEFIKSITIESLPSKWEQLEKLLKICNDDIGINNYILEKLNYYCLEYASIQLKTVDGKCLESDPIIERNLLYLTSVIDEPSIVTIDEETEIEPEEGIERFFNNSTSSDVKIKMGQDKYLYCHKTILSSKSVFFNTLFESGSTFSDLSHDGIFTPDESEDLTLLEIIIKSCYEIPLEKIDYSKLTSLLDLVMIHEIQSLINFYSNLAISVDNYFDIVLTFENYFDCPLFEKIFNELLYFGIENKKELFAYSDDGLRKLPEKFMQALIKKIAQN